MEVVSRRIAGGGGRRGRATACLIEICVVLLLQLYCIAVAKASTTAAVVVALDCHIAHGHSPVWDGVLNRLHFVDIEGQRVLSYDPADGTHDEVHMLEQVGCVVPHVQHRLLVAGQERLYHVGFRGKHGALRRLPGHTAIVPVKECEPVVLNPDETGHKAAPGARFHSGSCDAHGRLWLSFKRTTGKCDSGIYSLTSPPEWAPELDPDGVLHQVFSFVYFRCRSHLLALLLTVLSPRVCTSLQSSSMVQTQCFASDRKYHVRAPVMVSRGTCGAW